MSRSQGRRSREGGRQGNGGAREKRQEAGTHQALPSSQQWERQGGKGVGEGRRAGLQSQRSREVAPLVGPRLGNGGQAGLGDGE